MKYMCGFRWNRQVAAGSPRLSEDHGWRVVNPVKTEAKSPVGTSVGGSAEPTQPKVSGFAHTQVRNLAGFRGIGGAPAALVGHAAERPAARALAVNHRRHLIP